MENMDTVLSKPETLEWVRQRVASTNLSRYQLAREMCEKYQWRDVQGRYKEMACRKRLCQWHRRELIVLPAKRRSVPRARPVADVDRAPIEATLAELGRIELILVSTDAERLRWRTLMQKHPLKDGPLCGAQLRYIIRCERDDLGALAFSSAARRVQARDIYLGWTEAERAENLHRIVLNSRFLILPNVRVPHLASHILAQAAQRLSADWHNRYGITPWALETFVDEAHRGSCYRAANWIDVGRTQGRGRQDSKHAYSFAPKRVLLYPLVPKAFPRLGATRAIKPPTDWAEEEFGAVALDSRLVKRTQAIARDFFARPSANLPQACGTQAAVKAAYRFFDHPDTDMQTLLAGHYQSTTQRLQAHPIALAVCDSTSFNYSAHPATDGLGPIGSKIDGPVGLHMHETLVFTPEGTPLGLIDVQVWARDRTEFGKKHTRNSKPIEEKESYKWIQSWQATVKAQAAAPNTQLVMVADRESDIYELIALAQGERTQLLVRAEKNRKLTDSELNLWPHMEAIPAAGQIEVLAGRKKEQPARIARLTVRYAPVTLAPPKTKAALGSVDVWVVWAKEENPPEGIDPLDWMLITTTPTETLDDAHERLAWYATRWGIEIYHRTLKSGCKIEDRQLGNADRLEACLAIDLVVAWRVMYLVHLNREIPDMPATVYFSDMQWKALTAWAARSPTHAPTTPTLGEVAKIVAVLGGHLGRKSDGQPGAEAMWRGLQRADDITMAYMMFVPQARPKPPS